MLKKRLKKTIPDWVLVSKDEFERIYEDVNNYIKNRWYSKLKHKRITMLRVKLFLDFILYGNFYDPKKAKYWYKNNIFNYEIKFKKLKIKTDCNIDMIRLYDDVKKIFNHPTSPTSSEELESEELESQESETKDMPPLESEELETKDKLELESEESAS